MERARDVLERAELSGDGCANLMGTGRLVGSRDR